MINFKKCPRCNGDILLDKDHFGWYIECLQCGYLQDLQAIHGPSGLSHPAVFPFASARFFLHFRPPRSHNRWQLSDTPRQEGDLAVEGASGLSWLYEGEEDER